MATNFELTSWLKSLGLGDESVKNVVAAMGTDAEKVAPTIKSQVMAQSDYSRAMDELRTKEDSLKQEYVTKTEQEMTALAAARSEFDTRYQTALKERVEAQNRLALVQAEIDRVAAEYAVPDDALKAIRTQLTTAAPPATAPPAATPPPAVDPSKFMSMEQFTKEAAAYSRLPIEYMRIGAEHRSLFGVDPFIGDATGQTIMDKVLNRAQAGDVGTDGKRYKLSLRDAWEREFNVAAKREEVREAAIQSRIEAARKEAEQKVRSELALAGTPVRNPNLKLPGSPIFHDEHFKQGQPPPPAPTNANSPAFRRATASSADDRVNAAVAAFENDLSQRLETASTTQ